MYIVNKFDGTVYSFTGDCRNAVVVKADKGGYNHVGQVKHIKNPDSDAGRFVFKQYRNREQAMQASEKVVV